MIDIALFPIPNCVAFPGTIYPLHVFEPRYRTMVQTCSETGTPIAVCHVEKTLHPAKPDQPMSEALHTNQATYKPVTVVSAGHCDIVQTLHDGRLMVNIHHDSRYKILNDVQTIPYKIVTAEPYLDIPLTTDEASTATILKEKILHRLIALTADKPLVNERLASAEWQEKPAQAFSFDLFSVLQTDADVMQSILEMQSPVERLEAALDLLKQIPAQL